MPLQAGNCNHLQQLLGTSILDFKEMFQWRKASSGFTELADALVNGRLDIAAVLLEYMR